MAFYQFWNLVILDAVWMWSGCGLDAVWMRSGCGLDVVWMLKLTEKLLVKNKIVVVYHGTTILRLCVVFRAVAIFSL